MVYMSSRFMGNNPSLASEPPDMWRNHSSNTKKKAIKLVFKNEWAKLMSSKWLFVV